jgi:predicted nucleic acid-binding protein
MRFFSRGRYPLETNFMIALDTNILIYACDKADTERQQVGLDLVSNAGDRCPHGL